MSTKRKAAEYAKNSRNHRRKAEYAAIAARETAGQKRSRLKARNAVRVVGSYTKHPVNPCGNHACRKCYDRATA